MTEGSVPAQCATELPSGLEPYQRTATFTEAVVPSGMLKDHSTKLGVWGLIHVSDGELRYTVVDPRRAGTEIILTAESGPGIVEPTILHHVAPQGDVKFFVQFYRQAADAVPLCATKSWPSLSAGSADNSFRIDQNDRSDRPLGKATAQSFLHERSLEGGRQ